MATNMQLWHAKKQPKTILVEKQESSAEHETRLYSTEANDDAFSLNKFETVCSQIKTTLQDILPTSKRMLFVLIRIDIN